MRSIVLSCDKYHPLSEHMVVSYRDKWPSHNFKFNIPWNDSKPIHLLEKYSNEVELIQTPIEFKKTIGSLLDKVDDDEWIFWSTDDTYLISVDEEEVNITQKFVEQCDEDVFGVTFGYIRHVPHSIDEKDTVEYEGLRFVRRTRLTNPWAPQYWRAKVLKFMFESMEEAPKYKAKQMDYMLGDWNNHTSNAFWDIINQGKFYTLDHNVGIWGESTKRGLITINCADSFNNYGLEIPTTFEVSDSSIFFDD